MDRGFYLINYLFECGPFTAAAVGQAPLSWAEIDCWARMTGTDLKPWEARTIRTLSIVYVDQVQRSEKADCPAPHRAEIQKPADVEKRLREALRSLSRKRR